jgi:O-antigen/teichoic acid export membrane protein
VSSSTASRGTIALVFTQGMYFVLGYLVVVLLARELGPAAYGTYGVIMSVLVWLEQSAKRSVPWAAAKLISEQVDALDAVGKASLILNLVLHTVLLLLFWLMAPWLEVWFGIDNGTYLFRLAALDLPFYGIYTALQGIYQGQRRFFRLGVSDVAYVLAKVIGVIAIVELGISVESALIVNIASSVVGIVFLLTRFSLRWTVRWRGQIPAMLPIAAPMALYSVSNLLCSSLDVWLLKAVSGAAAAATVGIYLAALNIARVPGFALSTISQVLLPSVSNAVAIQNSELVRHYINQALRFFLILYLPTCLMLAAAPGALMKLVYSSRYAGGDAILVILVIAHGFWAIQAILAAVLVAAGRAWIVGVVTAVSVLASVPLLVGLIRVAGATGAAVASGLIALGIIVVFVWLLAQQLGAIVRGQNMARIAGAGVAMALVSVLSSMAGGGVFVATAAGLLAYGGTLIALGEVRAHDFGTLLPRTSVK